MQSCVSGYKIRINERLKLLLIHWWAFVGIVLTGVAVVLFSACTGDDFSAPGMGAYVVAVLAVPHTDAV